MSVELEWESFTTNDLFDDFNKVIEGSVHNMYNVSLVKYSKHISQLENIINLSMMLEDKGEGIQIEKLRKFLAEGQRIIKKFEGEKEMILKNKDDFIKKNDKEYKIDNYCLNKLNSDKNFTFSKLRLKDYFSSQTEKDEIKKMLEEAKIQVKGAAAGEPAAASSVAPPASPAASPAAAAGEPTAVQPGQEVELGGTTTAAAAAAVSSVTPKPAAGV